VADANPTQWLWAGDTLLGPNAQQRIGTLFMTRARNNPF
jgi:outer membrane lipase/esterase